MLFLLKARIKFPPVFMSYTRAYSVDHVRSRTRPVTAVEDEACYCRRGGELLRIIDDFSVSAPFEAIEKE